ncbi:MAG: saccharopine dehydrogenase family protein [Nocardioidaceae bacterium]
MGDRDYDLVLFGATGFTGGLTAEYLARQAPEGCRWAIAGRNQARLEEVRQRLAGIDPAYADLDLLTADTDRPETMRALAASGRVVISTVGPYIEYGEPLVAACADLGTDYVDLTGEPEFVDRMYTRYHARAQESGSRLVHACGFDSVPYDLGAYFTVGLLADDVPIHLDGYVRAGGGFSSGTYQSAILAFSRSRQLAAAAKERRAAETRPHVRRARARSGRPGRARDLGGWTLPLPTIDPQIVARSARAVSRYGPDFTYREHALVKRLPVALGGAAAAAGVMALAQLGPTREWLLRRVASGAGPSAEKRARSWFRVVFVGQGGGDRVVTEVSGGDPGHDEAAKMLAESAMCLAFDDNPVTSGQVTTAQAMGDHLLDRLRARGITFARQ